MDDETKHAINNLKIEIDRLRGQVAALTAYVAATANKPEIAVATLNTAAREASPSRLATGGPGAPADHAETHIQKIVSVADQLRLQND